MLRLVETRLVRIPRRLLHIELSDLTEQARDALRALLADLPLVPDGSLSAQLIGPPDATLPALAVLARHIGQGLRDHNLSFAHDRPRLRAERQKLVFLDEATLLEVVGAGNARPSREAVLFVADATPSVEALLSAREAAGLASFVTSNAPLRRLAHWRQVHLSA
jgi:hypothetical protein